ncbi:uncharacterized protein THITE_2107410 [Thermothielavioides terrestris NRRL 8126]|uniref:Inactive metallocarboxypeptidase ECM14 n=2 Tax=Thermothielavioides terrestris TaxID=2587410 RepID=G2QTT9_THETT|nr:uncharacterized protein THITE_2107410 [Thermothielavioides terrestris NRRL 8126]AEO62799.1 hypothetical protein THITE_2107410 [Thermothielavioides terrestris NRRL 8126]
MRIASLPVALAVAVAFCLPTVDGARVRSSQYEGDSHPDASGQVFPFLKWLRDSAVEVVFGKPPFKTQGARPGAQLQYRYRNDVVIRFNVTTSEEEDALARAAEQMFLDVWAFTPSYVDVRLDKDDVSALRTLLPRSLQPTVLIPDLAAAVWATYPSTSKRSQFESSMGDAANMRMSLDGVGNIFFRDYQTLAVIVSWMRLLEAMFPSIAQMTSVGKSYEGRDIFALRVGARSDNGEANGPRKTILITGGLHGREWISTSSVNYLLWSVITSYDREPMITKLLEHFDIVFIPVLNPDGYEYSWQSDRLWRKSRQQTKMRFCRGLDLDHAFGYAWDAAKHQTDPCSESYGGDQPFQAVEASELAKWAKNETQHGTKFVAFLDLHSYSQQILYPYAYTCSIDPPNRENLEELAMGLAKAIRLSSGEYYTVTSACEGAVARSHRAGDSTTRIEAGGGSAIDWFYHELHARYSYQIKLRDTGSYGFLLPSDNIVPTGEEMLNALKYLGDYLLGNNGIEESPFQQPTAHWQDLRRRRR